MIIINASPKMGLYDSKTGESIFAYKMFDATSFCSDSERCVIKYADVQRGKVAQICDWYKKDKDLGSNIHYHINELTPGQLALDVVFNSFSKRVGADAMQLANIIFENQ